jgi:hypothetical protein
MRLLGVFRFLLSCQCYISGRTSVSLVGALALAESCSKTAFEWQDMLITRSMEELDLGER